MDYQNQPPHWQPQGPPPKNYKPLIIGLAVGGGVIILALLAVIVFLLARRPVQEQPPSTASVSSTASAQSASTSSTSGTSGAVDFVGQGKTFRSTIESPTWPELTSRLFLYPGGFYLYMQDIYEGTSDSYGSYTIEGDRILCTPVRSGVPGSTISEPPAQEFTILDEDTIISNRNDEVFLQVDHVAPPLEDPRDLGPYIDESGNENNLHLNLLVEGMFYVSAFNKPWENEFGYTRINGSYSQQGDEIVCTIETMDNSGFPGDNLRELRFRMVGPDTLEYTGGQLGDISTGDIFKR